ncbi:MAG: AbrB/MazE/SpoVT family DNA-binding domain-containing protein [Caldilineaceae bacterium]
MITTITEQQTLTFPVELIRRLNLKPGAQLDWSVASDGTLIARPLLSRAERVRQAAGMGRVWLQAGQSAVAELIAARAGEDQEEGLL